MDRNIQIQIIAGMTKGLHEANWSRDEIRDHIASASEIIKINAPQIIQYEIIDRVIAGEPL